MNTVKAFVLGVREFRLTYTTNCELYDLAYDWGREIAHKLTFRYFDPA